MKNYSIIKLLKVTIVMIIVSGTFLIFGCKKMIEVDLPVNTNTAEDVFNEKSTAVSTMSGIYASMNEAGGIFTDEYGLSIRAGMLADELVPIVTEAYPDYKNLNTGDIGWSLWDPAYKSFIFRLNAIIEGLEKSTSLSEQTKSVLTAEAKFTRAWLYFYLVNFYGDVPLVLSTDFRVNSAIGRTNRSLVYDQIVSDLKAAQNGLSNNYLAIDLLSSTTERVRPNKQAATALLARVFLYQGNWTEAEREASTVINDPQYQILDDLNSVFVKNSKETIWALQPNTLDEDSKNTPDGRFLINPFMGDPGFYLSPQLINAFDSNDKRKEAWTLLSTSNEYIAYKYKEGWGTESQTEYTVVLRLSEQYLIRAEARAKLGRIIGDNSASADLNVIRLRAGLLPVLDNSQESILSAIAQERRLELFMEWGDRWLNLKRTGTIDQVMNAVSISKETTWQSYRSLLPIPYSEFSLNRSLRGHQNPGYSEQP
jgi:starch-binding outer membrane protein, SusD/RagB family